MRTLAVVAILTSSALVRAESPGRPAPGAAAPAFALPSTTGKPVRLGDFAGKRTVVLAFFPRAFTGG